MLESLFFVWIDPLGRNPTVREGAEATAPSLTVGFPPAYRELT